MATARMQEASRKKARVDNEVSGAENESAGGPPAAEPAPAPMSAGAAMRQTAIKDKGGATAEAWEHDRQILYTRELRERYRIPGGKQQLPVALVGFDLCNRDGIPINGHRCDALLKEFHDMGFDPDEANFDNVCIQERPGRPDLLEFNRRVCMSQPFLANVVGDAMQFGTVSHSHLHQCLRNIIYGAESNAPAGFMLGGRLSLEAVERAQPLLAAACRNGLEWEVLSWRIRDIPGAIEAIQAACNRKGGVAMRETEMQAIARLSSICTSLNQRASGVTFTEARDAMRKSMPHIADAPEFLGLLRFVVNVGADNAPFIADLKEFVGLRGQSRHVRANVFSCVSTLPLTVPHLMVALIVTAYSAPPSFFVDGYSKFVVASDIKGLMQSPATQASGSGGSRASGPEVTVAALKGEAVLRYFHRSVAFAFKDVATAQRLDFFGSLDSAVGRLLLDKHMGALEESCPDMDHLAEKFFADCLTLTGRVESSMPARVWTVPTGSSDPAKVHRSSRASGVAPVLPKIILFDEEGRAQTEQDVMKEDVVVESVDFAKTLQIAALDLELEKGQLLAALDHVQKALPKINALVHITRDNSGTVAVTAAKDLAKGELVLLPLVAGSSFLLPRKEKQMYHANSVQVGNLMIVPSVRMPPKGETVASSSKPSFIPPLWLISRSPIREEANCAWTTIGTTPVVNVALGDAPLDLGAQSVIVHPTKLEIPVVTNKDALCKGATLVLYAPAKASAAKGATEMRWEDSARASAKKAKQ